MGPQLTIPTDNIYKFAAVLGLWMMLGMLALFGWLIYLNFHFEDQHVSSRIYNSSNKALIEIAARLNSIEQGAFNENRLEWVPVTWDIEQEKHALKVAQENHAEAMLKNKWAIESEVGKELKYLEHPVVIVAIAVYIVTAVMLFFLGFKGWKTQVHDLETKLKQATIEMTKLSNQKLNLEIRVLKNEARHRSRPR